MGATALLTGSHEWSTRALETVLQPAGYRVLRAVTPKDAQDQARTARPDVVIVADPLADLDGVAACELLRRTPGLAPGVPIVGIASGAVPREQRLRWLRAGAWDCFGFPLDPDELLLKLANYLS
jgi:DNA-binding response OmpR family regulator